MSFFLYRMIRLGIGTVFLFSGATKMMAPVTFATLINAYGIIPENLTLPFAVFLAVFEIIAGVGLIFEMKGSLTAVLGLLILFIAVLGYGIRMGLDIDCGCFGPDDPERDAFHGLQTALYRDIVIIAGVIFLYAYRFQCAVTPRSIHDVFQIFKKGEAGHEIA